MEQLIARTIKIHYPVISLQFSEYQLNFVTAKQAHLQFKSTSDCVSI